MSVKEYVDENIPRFESNMLRTSRRAGETSFGHEKPEVVLDQPFNT
jgi:hypothetical protein